MTDKKWVDKDGNLWNGRSIIVDNMEIFNPQEEQLIAAGYTEYVEPEKTYEELLAKAIQQKLYEITVYDNGMAINSFNIQLGNKQLSDWFNPSKRSNYKNSVDAAELLGIETITIIINGYPVELSTQVAKISLAQIQLYADKCFMVTETHKATVKKLTTIEEVENYDYTLGYPEKLSFEIPYEFDDEKESEPEEEQENEQQEPQEPEVEDLEEQQEMENPEHEEEQENEQQEPQEPEVEDSEQQEQNPEIEENQPEEII